MKYLSVMLFLCPAFAFALARAPIPLANGNGAQVGYDQFVLYSDGNASFNSGLWEQKKKTKDVEVYEGKASLENSEIEVKRTNGKLDTITSTSSNGLYSIAGSGTSINITSFEGDNKIRSQTMCIANDCLTITKDACKALMKNSQLNSMTELYRKQIDCNRISNAFRETLADSNLKGDIDKEMKYNFSKYDKSSIGSISPIDAVAGRDVFKMTQSGRMQNLGSLRLLGYIQSCHLMTRYNDPNSQDESFQRYPAVAPTPTGGAK